MDVKRKEVFAVCSELWIFTTEKSEFNLAVLYFICIYGQTDAPK